MPHRTAPKVTVPLLLTVLLAASPVGAQLPATRSLEDIHASLNAHRAEFDYLLGDWEFTGANRDGPLHGRWSAVRVPATQQILDEFRILGDSGETIFVSTSLRAYNAIHDEWDLVSVDDRGTGLVYVGKARRVGAEMHIEQTFGAGTPITWMSRIRHYDIGADHFS